MHKKVYCNEHVIPNKLQKEGIKLLIPRKQPPNRYRSSKKCLKLEYLMLKRPTKILWSRYLLQKHHPSQRTYSCCNLYKIQWKHYNRSKSNSKDWEPETPAPYAKRHGQQNLRTAIWNANILTKNDQQIFINIQHVDVYLICEIHMTNQSYIKLRSCKISHNTHPENPNMGINAVKIRSSIKNLEECHLQQADMQLTMTRIEFT